MAAKAACRSASLDRLSRCTVADHPGTIASKLLSIFLSHFAHLVPGQIVEIVAQYGIDIRHHAQRLAHVEPEAKVCAIWRLGPMSGGLPGTHLLPEEPSAYGPDSTR